MRDLSDRIAPGTPHASQWYDGGEAFQLGPHTFPAKPEDTAFARHFWVLAESLLTKSKIQVHKPKVNSQGSGLASVL